MVRTIPSQSLAAGAARRRSARCKDAGKRGRRSGSLVGNKQQGRKQPRVYDESDLPSKRRIADEEDDDDYDDNERGDHDDDIVTTYTADSAIVDEENDHEDEESEDEEGDNSAAEEQQVTVRNHRQQCSGVVSSTSGRVRAIPASTSRNCQASAGNSTRHSSGNGTVILGTGHQRSGVSGITIPVGGGVANVSFGTNSVSSATTGSAVTPRQSSDGSGIFDTSNSGTDATSTTASEGQGPTTDNTYQTASAITYRGNHDVLQDQTFIRLPREVAETNRTANFLKERIQKFCKKELFKKVKFVVSDSGLQHVMTRMAGIFQIPMAKKQAFKSQFKKIVMDSLNAKRAFCEQQAGKVVLSKWLTSSTWGMHAAFICLLT